ncbi:MAG: hypothetical protein JNL97_16290, partial [Verrucomicrobiales bacterium]|nr:hypothetical protein [Verrucomicrobiales bacterium]
MNLPGARTWIGLALTTTVAWFALESIRPDTDWARVEAPVFAIPGTPYPVQIEFTRPSSDREFGVDLHAPSADRGASKVVGVARGVLEPGRTR